jgi:nitrogen-specific signal transduction histidine kinase
MKYNEFRSKISKNRNKDEENCRIWLKSRTRFQFQVKGKRNSIPIKHITHGVDYGGLESLK